MQYRLSLANEDCMAESLIQDSKQDVKEAKLTNQVKIVKPIELVKKGRSQTSQGNYNKLAPIMA